MAVKNAIVLQPDAEGNFSVGAVARSNVQKIDIIDVDLIVVTKGGDRYLLPGGGISAMNDAPPNVVFSDGAVSVSQLLGEVGITTSLSVETSIPSSTKTLINRTEDFAKLDALEKKIQKLTQKLEEQKEQLQQQHQDQSQQAPPEGKHDVSTLTANSEGSVEQMVQELQKIVENLHKSDYDYVAPEQFQLTHFLASPPPGVPAPLSMTPIVTLFMGNVVGTTTDVAVNPGYTTIYGGGGAVGSDALSQLGPRDALQFSAATIAGDNGNNIIYAEGPLVGNSNPAVSNSAYYSKEFALSVAGYFTSLNDVMIKGVPAGVSIVGATDTGNGVWLLPGSYILKQQTFTILYQTSAYTPGGNNTFDLEFDISGITMRHVTFQSVQTFRFQYMDVTGVDQIADPTLVYNNKGQSEQIYVLPTLDQPNIITAGDGINIVYGSRSDDTIILGNGNDQIFAGAGNNTVITGSGNSVISANDGINSVSVGGGNNTITLGHGANAVAAGNGINIISIGSGHNTVAVGSGNNTLTLGDGDNTIQAGGGGGLFNIGSGSNTITITSSSGSANTYNINTNYLNLPVTGTVTNSIYGGDNNYLISMGAGTNAVMLGNSTSSGDGITTFDTVITAGAGFNTITTGSGTHKITIGAGASVIQTGAGNNLITTAGGGGSITTSAGDETIVINSASGSNENYAITTGGAGTSNIAAGDGSYTIRVGSGANTISIGSGTSSITATGAGIDNITTGNGAMTIAAGAGDNIIRTGTGVANITSGDGDNTITTAGGGGVIAVGNGANTLTVTAGDYTITTGSGNDAIAAGDGNSMISAGNGTNTVTVGNGNNTIVVGSGDDTINVGSGDNIITAGLGTNVIAAGSGINTLDLSDITTTALAITLGNGITHGSATGTGISDDLLGISTIFGTNLGDNITITGGDRTVYAGSGNDIIRCGSGTNTIYAGNGNNTVYGGTGAAYLHGGTGNNAFLTPAARTSYDGTNGANISAIANNLAYTHTNTTGTDPLAGAAYIPDTISYSYSGGAATFNLYLDVQLNKINYSTTNTSLTINLYNGTGSSGIAQGSTYAMTPTSGYNSINYIITGNGADALTASRSDTVLVGGIGTNNFYDTNTVTEQKVFLVGNGNMYLGAAREVVVGSSTNSTEILYSSSPAGTVINLDRDSHTFSSALFSSPVTVTAYSGTNWGSNAANSRLSWSTGDFFLPVTGYATGIYELVGSSYGNNIIYAPSNTFLYYCGGGTGISDYYFGSNYASSNTMQTYYMNAGKDACIGGSGFNVYFTYTSYNIFGILSKSVEAQAYANGWITTAQYNLDNAVNLSYGGTTYTGFAYGWSNTRTPVGASLTYISDFDNFRGYSGNDFIIGNNNGNQINASTGINTIIAGAGDNIITAIEGFNTIYSTGTSNTLNFETLVNLYSGTSNGTLANCSSTAAAGVQAFLNNDTDTTFFNAGTGGDQVMFWGGTSYDALQVRTGTTGQYAYSSVQSGIISMLNGGDYSSGTTNSTNNSIFNYDHVYSGASTIRGHGGNSVYLDNIGTGDSAFYGGTGSDVYYLTPSQVSSVTISDALNLTTEGILRVPGWGSTTTSGNAFGTVDPFSTTKITGINVIDVRSGLDTVTSSSLTLGSHSTTNTNNVTFNLSASNIQNLTADSTTPTLYLKLDNGEHFTPTGTVDTVTAGSTVSYYNSTTHTSTYLLATNTHNSANYYSDALVYNDTNNAHLNIHYGSG